MPLSAAPPDFPAGAGSNILRSERSIFSWMPLPGQLRIYSFKTIVFIHSSSRTIRAALVSASVRDISIPLMALIAEPPNFDTRAKTHILRRERRILHRMPLAREFGLYRSQAVLISRVSPRAVWAAGATAPSAHWRAPFVTFPAYPPHLDM